MRARRITACLTAIGCVVFIAASPGFAGGQFKRFPQTISPDGAYALAWGPTTDSSAKTAELIEVPYEDEAFDKEQPDSVDNYLIDAATRKIVATIPGFEYFRGPKWHKNRGDLELDGHLMRKAPWRFPLVAGVLKQWSGLSLARARSWTCKSSSRKRSGRFCARKSPSSLPK